MADNGDTRVCRTADEDALQRRWMGCLPPPIIRSNYGKAIRVALLSRATDPSAGVRIEWGSATLQDLPDDGRGRQDVRSELKFLAAGFLSAGGTGAMMPAASLPTQDQADVKMMAALAVPTLE